MFESIVGIGQGRFLLLRALKAEELKVELFEGGLTFFNGGRSTIKMMSAHRKVASVIIDLNPLCMFVLEIIRANGYMKNQLRKACSNDDMDPCSTDANLGIGVQQANYFPGPGNNLSRLRISHPIKVNATKRIASSKDVSQAPVASFCSHAKTRCSLLIT